VLYLAAMLSGLWGGQGVARIGAVRLSQLAMLACAVGALAAASGHPILLLVAAAVVGAGYGMVHPASTTLLGRHSPVARRGLFASVGQAGVPGGVALAGASFPALLPLLGWRMSVLGAGAACAALALALLPAAARLDARTAPGEATATGRP